MDPLTRVEMKLFNPRVEVWAKHFYWVGAKINGLTPTGRATIEALQMNRSLAVAIRNEEALRGRHPSNS